MRHELTTLSMRKELYLLLLLDVGPQWAGSWHMSSHTRANVSKHRFHMPQDVGGNESFCLQKVCLCFPGLPIMAENVANACETLRTSWSNGSWVCFHAVLCVLQSESEAAFRRLTFMQGESPNQYRPFGAVAASSSSDSAHGAAMSVDGSSSTFWALDCKASLRPSCLQLASQASAMDPVGPVSLTLDLGSEKRLADLEIDWEYPAKAFSVDVSGDGIKWKQLYGTDSNVLASTSIALGNTAAKHVKVTMREARSHTRRLGLQRQCFPL